MIRIGRIVFGSKFMKPEFFTVSQYLELLNVYLRREEVSVVGEVVEFKPGARWVGFTLKDKEDDSIMKCVLGAWDFKRIGVPLEVGMEVKVSGAPSISKKYGSFGFWARNIEPVGEGALRQAYELLLKQLKADGLFDRKRALPDFVEHIGVVSSREGVVIHDFMNNLSHLGLRITFVDARVEGEHAPGQLVSALKTLIAQKPDLIVVIRGGGSLESMQAFNNERVCRAIYASPIPVAVGIGHDVDVPLACLVADASASTPTAVAHMVNASWAPLTDGLPRYARDIERGLLKLVSDTQRVLRGISERITSLQRSRITLARDVLVKCDRMLLGVFHTLFAKVSSLDERIARSRLVLKQAFKTTQKQIEENRERILRGMTFSFEDALRRLISADRLISFASPERTLARGYSIVFDAAGRVVKKVEEVSLGDTLTTRIFGGSIESTVTKQAYEQKDNN